jgi:hypothetical protein
MRESKTFSLLRKSGPDVLGCVAVDCVDVVTVTAATITGAEQNIVLLDEDGKAVAVVELQPGVDRRQI